VFALGDVDGDGYDDVGMQCDANPGNNYRFAVMYVFRGSAAGIATASSTTILLNALAVGGNVALGDVNGDGYSDIALADSPCTSQGCGAPFVGVFFGSSAGLGSTSNVALQLPHTGSNLFVAALGDVNGDTFADVGVEATWGDANGNVLPHLLYFQGLGASMPTTPTQTLNGTNLLFTGWLE
jgi:hypothetical protein